MSVRQAEDVAARILRLGLPLNVFWDGRPAAVESPTSPAAVLDGGIKITLLSPRLQDIDRLANFWEKSLRGAPDSSGSDADEPPQRADEATGAESLVYVVSAHGDERWRDQLQEALAPLLKRVVWSAEMPAGELGTVTEEFRQRRDSIIQHARIGVVLVSPDALASEWVREEISTLARAATESQMVLTWILLRASLWHDTPLAQYQALGNLEEPLSTLPRGKATQRLAEIAKQIARLAPDRTETPKGSSRRQRGVAKGRIDVEELAQGPFAGDRSVINNASIAFLAEYEGKSLLICGDASADILAESIRELIRQRSVRRLRVDAIVVPRGGSAHNLHRQLLELLDCDRYLIPTSGERYGHPDRETIARILTFGRTDRSVPLTLVFNYRAPATAVWDDPELQRRWNYRAIYPQNEGGGIRVQI